MQPVETIVMWQTLQWLKIHKEVALPPTMPNAGKDIIDGAGNAGKDVIDGAGDAGKDVIDGAGDAVRM